MWWIEDKAKGTFHGLVYYGLTFWPVVVIIGGGLLVLLLLR